MTFLSRSLRKQLLYRLATVGRLPAGRQAPCERKVIPAPVNPGSLNTALAWDVRTFSVQAFFKDPTNVRTLNKGVS